MKKYIKKLVEGCGKLSQKELSHSDNFGPSLNVFHLAHVNFRSKNAQNDENTKIWKMFVFFHHLL